MIFWRIFCTAGLTVLFRVGILGALPVLRVGPESSTCLASGARWTWCGWFMQHSPVRSRIRWEGIVGLQAKIYERIRNGAPVSRSPRRRGSVVQRHGASAREQNVIQVKGTEVKGTQVQGTVQEVLPQAVFRVRLGDGRQVLAHVAPALRMHLVRLIPGDTVTLELLPRDLGRGRIIARGS